VFISITSSTSLALPDRYFREQDQTSVWQGTESVNVSVAVCCGMKMKTTPSPQLKTVGSREVDRAEPADIWRARNFIHEHSDEELSLTQVAKAVNISGNHLSEKFKQVTGINFVEYVAHTRFEKARGLLHDPNLRVSEIAFAVGFQSLSQFNRVFKKLSGKSPTQYRAARAPK
jgi:AraC-like DNA-binding protein